MTHIAVILGAGASSDSVGFEIDDVAEELRPPLTSELFAFRFREILRRYPEASALASSIRVASSEDPLESILRRYSEEEDTQRSTQFRQVPLYLRRLLGDVSSQFTRQPSNYVQLVNTLLASQVEHVSFITLNYDTLLEQCLSLRSLGGEQTRDTDWYINPARRWSVLKLHGSVDWGRKFLRWPRSVTTRDGVQPINESMAFEEGPYLELVHSAGDPANLSEEIQIFAKYDTIFSDGSPIYPALVAPVDGKYGFVMPPSHLRFAESVLAKCDAILIVGASGRDADLIDLFRKNLTHCLVFWIVADAADADATRDRFTRAHRVLQLAPNRVLEAGRFTQFVRDRGVERFLQATLELTR